MASELSAIVHVHSTYSDGTATVPELIDATRAARADVLMLTDHDTLQARRDGWEGWHEGVLVIVGHEISPKGGHLLAFGLDEEVPHDGAGEAEACREVARRGGLAIAAHPFSEGSRMSRRIAPPHGWPALEDPALAGVELWSLATDVAESWRHPGEAWRALRHPERAVDGPPERHLRIWDALCARRRVVAIGGLDAHAPGIRWRGRVRSVMPHARWFGMLRTQVQLDAPPTGQAGADAEAVLAAVRAGRCHLARVDLADPLGFELSAERADGATARMGDEAPAGDWVLRAEVPAPATLRLVRAGEVLAQDAHARALEHRVREPGAYRVEAWLPGPAGHTRWIVSNPVYLR